MRKRERTSSLALTERWMQAKIMRPDDLRDAPAKVLRDVGSLPAVVGLGIYQRAYHARHLECLEKEFPVLMKLLGKELFAEFAREYVAAYPPKRYTLADLGRDFPRFLRETRPVDADWAALLVDLASLERAFGEVYDAPEKDARRQLVCEYPVHEYFAAARSGAELELPARRNVVLLVQRPDERVLIREMLP